MTAVQVVEQLIYEIPAAQAVGLVDLKWGLTVAERYNPVAALPPDYLTVLAAMTSDIFKGSYMNVLEQYEELRTNKQVTDLLLEAQITTAQGYHLMVRIPHHNYALLSIVSHSVNLINAWVAIRGGAVRIAPFL